MYIHRKFFFTRSRKILTPFNQAEHLNWKKIGHDFFSTFSYTTIVYGGGAEQGAQMRL
jgi:hypothetical protein